MRKNKRLLAWVMVLAMGLMTAGCGAGKDVDTSTETATEQTETEAENLIRDLEMCGIVPEKNINGLVKKSQKRKSVPEVRRGMN